jgi:hypothetical protein
MRLRRSTVPVLPVTPTFPVFNLERHERRIQQVAQFMCEEPEALVPARVLSIDVGPMSLAAALRHPARDGVVQASVQYPKVFGADRCG